MTAGATSAKKRKAGPRCPICREPAVKVHRPFCSKRCADVDLGRWLKGTYAVPGEPVPGEPVSGDLDAFAGFSGLEPDDDRG